MSTRTRAQQRLLVIDFDYFFPQPAEIGQDTDGLYDWGHAETAFLRDMVWPARAATFLAKGLQLPRCVGDYDRFWARFSFTDSCLAWIADSNAYAGTLAHPRAVPDGRVWRQVWLFDAHHDSGYRQTFGQFTQRRSFSCEDWTYPHYAAGSDIFVRYPRWKRPGLALESAPHIRINRRVDTDQPHRQHFTGLFICRSGSWVPAWCDTQWRQFLQACPIPAPQRHILDADTLATPRWSPTHQQQADTFAAQYRQHLTHATRRA